MPNETITQTDDTRLTVGWSSAADDANRAPVSITAWCKFQGAAPGTFTSTLTASGPLTTGDWIAAPGTPLDCDAIDHLMRTLAKARRQAYGQKLEGRVAISMPRNSDMKLHPTTAMVIDLANGKPLAVTDMQIRIEIDGACTADLTVYADADGHPMTLDALGNVRSASELATAPFTYEVLAFGVNANKGDEVPAPPTRNVFAVDVAFRDAFPALALDVDDEAEA